MQNNSIPSRDSWVDAFRYIRKKDLIAALEGVPDDVIIYGSPATSGLVLCEQTGPDVDMSAEISPYPDGRPVTTPKIDPRALLVWYADGSSGIDPMASGPGWWNPTTI